MQTAQRPLPIEAVPSPGRPSAHHLLSAFSPPSSLPHTPKADLRPASPQCSLDTHTAIARTVQGWTYTPALSRPILPRAHSDGLSPACVLQVLSSPSENRMSGGWGGPKAQRRPAPGPLQAGRPRSPRPEGPSSPEAQPETLQAEQ